MSGRTRKRLIVGCVLALVCGAVVFAVMMQRPTRLIGSLVSLNTNQVYVRIFAEGERPDDRLLRLNILVGALQTGSRWTVGCCNCSETPILNKSLQPSDPKTAHDGRPGAA